MNEHETKDGDGHLESMKRENFSSELYKDELAYRTHFSPRRKASAYGLDDLQLPEFSSKGSCVYIHDSCNSVVG